MAQYWLNASLVIPESELPGVERDALLGSSGSGTRLAAYYRSVLFNYPEAFYWARIAAQNGDNVGEVNFAYELLHGVLADLLAWDERTRRRSRLRAEYWLRRAAAKGDELATDRLGRLGVPVTPPSPAQCAPGEGAAEGAPAADSPPGISEAELFALEGEALLGSPEAASRLYWFHNAAKVSLDEEAFWVEIAAENAATIGEVALAEHFLDEKLGKQFSGGDASRAERNRIRARFWLEKAARKGSQVAIERLDELRLAPAGPGGP